MVDMAVRILEKNPKGYFLLVEGNCSLTANAWKMSSNISIYLLIITFLILFAVWLNHYLLFVLVLFANSAFFSFIFSYFFLHNCFFVWAMVLQIVFIRNFCWFYKAIWNASFKTNILRNYSQILLGIWTNSRKLQKQTPEVFCKKRCSWKFRKFSLKTTCVGVNF